MPADVDTEDPSDIDDDGRDATSDSQDSPPADEATPHRRRRLFLVFLGYLGVSLVYWRHSVPHLATRTLAHGLSDPGQFIWWFKWTPYALTHGLNPLHTTFLDAPAGVSAMWNTSVIALGLLFAPVTLAFGPVASFNLACILGPPLSAFTASRWLRRHGGHVPALIGGLVFGFSPFVIAHARAGHLNFSWLFLLPVIAMLLEDLVWRASRPLWPQAPLLALAISVQLLIGAEALLIMSMSSASVVVVLAVTNPRATRERLRTFLPAAAVAIGAAAVLCALPLAELLGNRNRIKEPVQKLGAIGGNTEMLVGASKALLFHTHLGPIAHLTSVENGLYIGWPLIALLAAITVWLLRRRGVLIAAATIAIAVAFQMYGTYWRIFGHRVRLPLRFVQDQLPLARNVLPGRFAIAMWLAIAWLLVVGLDTAVEWTRGRNRALCYALVIACIVPLTPGQASPAVKLLPIPALFTSPALRQTIPSGATVMLAPMATVYDTEAELWQIKSGMRFHQIGGFALHAINEGRTPSYYPDTKMLRTLFMIDVASRPYGGKVTARMLDGARRELRTSRASLFLVGPSPDLSSRQLEIARQLLGRPPARTVGGVAIWELHPSG